MPFHFKMSRTGKITDLKNVNADSAKIQFACNLVFQGMVQTVPEMYPIVKVSRGEKWTINNTLLSSAFSTTGTIYELKEVTDNTLVISGTSIVKTNVNEENRTKANANPMPDLTTTTALNIKIDRKTGWIIEAKINQTMKETMTEKVDPKKPGTKVSQINMNSETTLSGE